MPGAKHSSLLGKYENYGQKSFITLAAGDKLLKVEENK
jgi:hypothetical protein